MRDYKYLAGPETAALPTSTDPAAAADLVTKNYADNNYLKIAGGVAPFTLANNQSSAANITGLLLDFTQFKAVEIKYAIERRTSTQGFRQYGKLVCQYDVFSGLWSIEDFVDAGSSGATTGVAFSILNAGTPGQVQYVSDNMSGSTYVGNFTYKIINEFA